MKMKASLIFSTIIFFGVGIAAYKQNETTNECSCSDPIRVVTFNTALFVAQPFLVERMIPQIGTFFQYPADVVCFQELSVPDIRNFYISQLIAAYPYISQTGSVEGECANGCDIFELAPSLGCMLSNCFDLFSDSLALQQCTVQNCFQEISKLSISCASCISDDPNRPFEKTLITCLGRLIDFHEKKYLNCQNQYYSSTFSKRPFTKKEFFPFSTVPKGTPFIGTDFTQIEDSFGRKLNIYCNHLDAFQDSYNEIQTKELLKYAQTNDQQNPATATILLGDFNNGIASPNSPPLRPENMEKILGSGYEDSLSHFGNERCTWCEDNPLNFEGVGSQWIDHHFLKKNSENVCLKTSTIQFTEKIVELMNGEMVPLSDHFGVVSEICLGKD